MSATDTLEIVTRIYCLADGDDLRGVAVSVVGQAATAVPRYVRLAGRTFEFDPTDVLSAHDGETCLVSQDGLRYRAHADSLWERACWDPRSRRLHPIEVRRTP
jgi:hypothetical protein